MIKALIFDLDGTLIQTEVLKASSYAKAIAELTDSIIGEDQVLDVFQKYVGLSRPEVVTGLREEFSGILTELLDKAEGGDIDNAIINTRLRIYRQMLNDELLLSNYFCSYSLGLLKKAHLDGFKVVLATMSHLPEASKVIDILGIRDQLDIILTRDDVKKGKPDPEIYLKARDLLGITKDECLVIEDSVNGIRAGQNAGMTVFAVTNSVTRKSVHDCQLLDNEFIVDDLRTLVSRVYNYMNSNSSQH